MLVFKLNTAASNLSLEAGTGQTVTDGYSRSIDSSSFVDIYAVIYTRYLRVSQQYLATSV